MSNVVATAPDLALVEGCGNSTALSILQSMNELRKQDFFTDIHVEVRQALVHLQILFHTGITWEVIQGTQSGPCSPIPRP